MLHVVDATRGGASPQLFPKSVKEKVKTTFKLAWDAGSAARGSRIGELWDGASKILERTG